MRRDEPQDRQFAAMGALIPRLGVATVLTLMIVGQLLSSLVFDRCGLLGMPQHQITPVRLLGATSLIAGAAKIRL